MNDAGNMDLEAKVAQSFHEMVKEWAGFDIGKTTPASKNPLLPRALTYKQRLTGYFEGLAALHIKEVTILSQKMEGRLVDVKGICEDLDSRMPELIVFVGRAELMAELKELSGLSG
eukprot:10256442-Alexandrium_andersonii.AAC.1